MRPTRDEAVRTVLRRMMGQAGGGLSEQVQPIAQPALQSRVEAAEQGEIVFTLPGSVSATASPRWYPPRGISVVKVFGSLTASGASTTTVDIKRNGTTIATLSFGSGVFTATDTTVTTPGLTADTDYLTAEVTAVGTGATNLTVQVRYT